MSGTRRIRTGCDALRRNERPLRGGGNRGAAAPGCTDRGLTAAGCLRCSKRFEPRRRSSHRSRESSTPKLSLHARPWKSLTCRHAPVRTARGGRAAASVPLRPSRRRPSQLSPGERRRRSVRLSQGGAWCSGRRARRAGAPILPRHGGRGGQSVRPVRPPYCPCRMDRTVCTVHSVRAVGTVRTAGRPGAAAARFSYLRSHCCETHRLDPVRSRS
jgi:hypothetical protein